MTPARYFAPCKNVPTDAKPDTALAAPKKKKKKQSAAAMQRELRDLARPSPDAPEKPPVDIKKVFVRVGLVIAVVWVIAGIVARWTIIPVFVAGALTRGRSRRRRLAHPIREQVP